MEMKFKGIINHTEFENLKLSEKYQVLINNNIYIKGSSKSILNEYEIASLGFLENYYNTSFFGKSFKINNIDYKLNDDLINEIFDIQKIHLEKVFNNCEYSNSVLKNQLFYYSDFEIKEKSNELINNKKEKLGNKIYLDLKTQTDFYDKSSSFKLLKKYVVYDYNLIYDHLINIDNNSNSLLCHTYHSYLYTSFQLNSLSEHNTNSENPQNSLPKKIALLHDLGLFDTDIFKAQIETNKYKLLAFLFDIEFDNKNKLEGIRRNLSSCKEFTNENTNKYTAIKHVNKIIKEILGNSN